jgi:hypothetical protein
MVALTGIEPAENQFSSVQLGVSSCVFGPVRLATRRLGSYGWLTCCSGAAPRDPITRVIQSPPITPRSLGRAAPGNGVTPAQPVGPGMDKLRRGAGTHPPSSSCEEFKSTRWVIVWCVVGIVQKCRREHSTMGIIGSVMWTLPLCRKNIKSKMRLVT